MILRQGQKIHLEKENHARGVVTSGTYSPSLKMPIALARLPKSDSTSCFAEIRGKRVKAIIGSPKFIKERKSYFQGKSMSSDNEVRYLSSHEWGRIDEEGIFTVGISDHTKIFSEILYL